MTRIPLKATLAATLALAATLGSTFTAGAHDRRLEEIDARQARQVEAIELGRRDGSLTWYERYMLRREQARISQMAREALSDGKLSGHEMHRIREAQDLAGRHIREERHDEQVRGWWWRTWR